MNGWPAKERVKAGGVSVPASETDFPVSQEVPLSAAGALRMVVAITASSVTGTVDLKLQSSVVSGEWVDAKSTTISAAGTVYIKLLAEAAGDQTYLPLLNKARIVATTGAGEDITVSSVLFIQEQ